MPPFGMGSGQAQNPYAPTGSQNPYFDKNNTYGAPDFGWLDAPYGGGHYYNQPGAGNQAAYTAFTSGWGGGFDPFSQFVQGQKSKVNQGYESALGVNPDLKWTDFLQSLGGEDYFRRIFNNADPATRGERRGQFVPPARWQSRQF